MAIAIGMAFAMAVNHASGDDARWQPLFNGTNLDGWYTYRQDSGKDADADGMFQIHDGLIHIYKDVANGSPAPAGYFASKAEFAYFRLRFQYKWGEKRFAPRANSARDSGLLYHVTGANSIWPRSIECQVQERDTGDCFTVMGTQVDTTADPKALAAGTVRFQALSENGVQRTQGSSGIARIVKSGNYEIDGWNTVEVIVRGSEEAVHIVNGHINFRATNLRQLSVDGNKWVPLARGRILFQAEHSEVLYRNIEIQSLPEGPLHGPAPDDSRPQLEGVQSRPIAAGPSGGFHLRAASAEVFGRNLTFDRDLQALDGWRSSDDRATWHIKGAKAGKYRIVTDYACMPGFDGQEFALVVGSDGTTVRGKTQARFHWNDFIERTIGVVELREGDQEITFRPAGEVRNRFVVLRSIRLIPEGATGIQVPEDFVVEPVAQAPLVTFPMVACFDDRGRLFVAESSGENGDAASLTRTKPHRIVLLEDTDADGRFDRRTIFADKLVQPNGVQWYAGALYITEPPGIWRLEDRDGDGVSDHREHIQARFPIADMTACMELRWRPMAAFIGADHSEDGYSASHPRSPNRRSFLCLMP